MLYAMQRMLFEEPTITALGPHWAAIIAGFAVLVLGEVYITPAGERYLEEGHNVYCE